MLRVSFKINVISCFENALLLQHNRDIGLERKMFISNCIQASCCTEGKELSAHYATIHAIVCINAAFECDINLYAYEFNVSSAVLTDFPGFLYTCMP